MQNYGIARYDRQTLRFMVMPSIGGNNNPFRMIEDEPDHFLVCTWGDGLFAMDLKALPGNPFQKVGVQKEGRRVPINDIAYSMVKDNKAGYIWIVTFDGLVVLQKRGNTYNQIESESMFPEPYYKLFHEIMQDRQGNLWLGSVGDGIFRLKFNNSSIRTNSLAKLKQTLGFSPIVVGFCESADGYIYIVVNRKGVFAYNRKTGDVSPVANPEIRSIQSVSALKRIRSTHEIWLKKEGTPGIYIMSDRVNNAVPVRFIPLPKKNAVTNSGICEDHEGNVWIGMEDGLYRRSVGSDNVTLVNPGITNVAVIKEDTKGNIWVGSEKQGILKLQKKPGSRSFVVEKVFSKTKGNLQTNSIQSICCRKNGDVCIGTRVGSIYIYDEKTNTMQDVSRLYGITEESVLDILEDNQGALWISTVKKIIRFNPSNHMTTYYTHSDGILVSSFAKDACIKLADGTMMFGGNKGLCAFAPNANDKKSASGQKVYITDIEVKNQSIFDNDSSQYYDADKKRLTLKSSDDDLSLEFSSLNLSSADKIQYAYKLDGLNNDWVYMGNNRRFVNYTNLPAGKYTFMVKATDESGTWSNQITTLEIIKKPPFYLSWWAYLVYLILLGVGVYFVYNRIKLRNKLRISQIEKEKSEELVQTKLRYFTNISHDLLTPLSIISLLVDELLQKHREDQAQIDKIKSNVDRLKRLIRQILAFRKIESGNMNLSVKQADIVAFIREVCYTNFLPLIQEKSIDFSLTVEAESLSAYFDPDKLDKVLYNILSNALKFTPEGGEIKVKASFPESDGVKYLQLSVSDSGKGIDEKDLPHIFTRFYISSSSDQSQSNGIGLALTRDLIQIHKGEIRAENIPGKGACFTFRIPVFREAFADDEINPGEIYRYVSRNKTPELNVADEPAMISNPEPTTGSTLLVVEDNKELNRIIVDYLGQQYKVLYAYNGVEALSLVAEHDIDLIISDVMMPEMDGLTLCRTLKSDLATSHIDILLLTAKVAADDQVQYFKAGADAYIPKPFEMKVLEARVQNLIEKRKQKAGEFRVQKEVGISAMQYNSLDNEFMKKALEVVEARMGEFTFDFDRFAIEMNVSKSTLHRKLKSLTELSPGEFIRNVRLKHERLPVERPPSGPPVDAGQVGTGEDIPLVVSLQKAGHHLGTGRR
ncbi:MAG: ATP-binding protein, partial [Bacteroidota bacterium]|nr:ATP-binding protein [Bacteroidota bacterium]